MGRIYLILIVAIGLMGAFAGKLQSPSGTVRTMPDAARTETEARSSDASPAFAQTTSGSDLVLERRDDGHFYADVQINGVPVRMLVDTGASGIALSADDARSAGIATSIGMTEVVGEGAGGKVHGDVVTLERIRLGGHEQTDVPAVVLKGGSMSLLGQSFLRDFDKVEISGDKMLLR